MLENLRIWGEGKLEKSEGDPKKQLLISEGILYSGLFPVGIWALKAPIIALQHYFIVSKH